MKKPIPTFRTDKEAEDFAANADLTEYDLPGGQVVRFEMRRKDKAVSLQLPEKLLEAVRGEAKREGVPYQQFIRTAIESALHKAAQVIAAACPGSRRPSGWRWRWARGSITSPARSRPTQPKALRLTRPR